MRQISICVFYVLVLIILQGRTDGRVIYVSQSGDGTTGNNWEMAFNTISDALVVSVTNDEIRVADENFNENIKVNVPLKVIGGFEFGAVSSVPTDRTTLIPKDQGPAVELLADSTISHFEISGGFGLSGSAIYVVEAKSLIFDCVLRGNVADYLGAGISCYKASLSIQSCTISNNTAKKSGGGMFCLESQVVLRDSVIYGNLCLGIPPDPIVGVPPQPGEGGGVFTGGGESEIVNCLFYNNEAEIAADIFFSGGPIRCENCTFGSDAYTNVWRGDLSARAADFVSSIFWGNSIPLQGPNLTVNYSNVRGGFAGEGNINQDPLFVNPVNGDFHLQASSPCIDSASLNGPEADLDGNLRPIDVPDTGREETGDEFDMGAYEFVPTPSPTMVNPNSDINQSGKVDSEDILIFMADWKKVAPPEEN